MVKGQANLVRLVKAGKWLFALSHPTYRLHELPEDLGLVVSWWEAGAGTVGCCELELLSRSPNPQADYGSMIIHEQLLSKVFWS